MGCATCLKASAKSCRVCGDAAASPVLNRNVLVFKSTHHTECTSCHEMKWVNHLQVCESCTKVQGIHTAKIDYLCEYHARTVAKLCINGHPAQSYVPGTLVCKGCVEAPAKPCHSCGKDFRSKARAQELCPSCTNLINQGICTGCKKTLHPDDYFDNRGHCPRCQNEQRSNTK